jgi:Ca2+-binding RTX toxin-like protein
MFLLRTAPSRRRGTLRQPALALALVGLVAAACGGPRPGSAARRIPGIATVPAPRPAQAPDDLPLLFIENQGQAAAGVTHYLQGSQSSVSFGLSGLELALPGPDRRLRVGFAGANPTRPQGTGPSGTSVNYLVGDAAGWRRDVPATTSLRYDDLWPGIDLVYAGAGSHLKYTLYVHPGADPGQIALSYQGANGLRVTGQGDLEVGVGSETFLDERPVAWQEIGGARVPVAVEHTVDAGNGEGTFTSRFAVGGHDDMHELVIDPTVGVYAGYLGGAGDDIGTSIAVDGESAAYITGDTASLGISPPSAIAVFDQTYNGGSRDAFVAKVRPDGSGFEYVTYVGGTGDDASRGIAVDGDGSAYITGGTTSVDFPVSPTGVYDSVPPTSGLSKAFVFKLSPNGAARTYGTYLQATNSAGRGIAVDGGGNAVVAGNASTITPHSAYHATPYGMDDAFVAKLDANGATSPYATYLGGSKQDLAFGVDIDPSGRFAYVTGSTKSANFPHPGSPAYSGLDDAFVAKLDMDYATLVYSRLFGGTGNDAGRAVAVDTYGNAIAVGETSSLTINSWTVIGPSDGLVAKLSPTGAVLSFQLVGGMSGDGINGVAVDGQDNVYVAGGSGSTILMPPLNNVAGPVLSPNINSGGDAFVIEFPPSLGPPIYGGYFGGPNQDYAADVAVDWGGFAYVVGTTRSSALATNTSGYAALQDAFYLKVGPRCTVVGTPGNDVIDLDNNVDDVICGLDGDDTIVSTGWGNDIVIGGPGNDSIMVGDGNDIVDGGPGDDHIGGGNGNDMVFGGAGNDTIYAGEGNDAVDGGTGADVLDGGSHRNVIRGGGGGDAIDNNSTTGNVTDGGGPTGVDACTTSGAVAFC